MNRLKLLIASLFLIALGTGIVVGMGMSKAPKAEDRKSWLADELNLTPDQSERMRTIWSDISRPGQSSFERRRQLGRERDDAVKGLLTEQQKTAYEAIQDNYNLKMAELNHEREQAFQAAVESTKDILTEQQRVKYDELLRRGFRSGRGEGPPREGFSRGEGWRGSSTRRGFDGGPGRTRSAAPEPAAATEPAPTTP